MDRVAVLDFPLEEYAERIKRICREMADANCDGVMITLYENMRYFCGMQPPFWFDKLEQPGVLLIARDGAKYVVCPEKRRAAFENGSTLKANEIISFDSAAEPGGPSRFVEAVSQAIERLGLQNGRIGHEYGPGSRLHICYNDYMALKSRLGDRLAPFSQNIWNIRSIKSPREIAVMRQACEISGKCYEKAFQSVVLDKSTETDIYEIFSQEAFRLGADGMPPLIVFFGQERYLQVNCPPTNRRVITSKKHEMLQIDCGPSLKGYITDTIRNAVVGGLSPRQQEMQKVVDGALDLCLRMAKPGVRSGDICDKVDQYYEKMGYGEWNISKGFAGHGLGLDVHELPTITSNSDMVLQAGMVLAFEPILMEPDTGIYVTEHNVLVTENGCENLTPWLPEIYVLES